MQRVFQKVPLGKNTAANIVDSIKIDTDIDDVIIYYTTVCCLKVYCM